MKNYIKNASTVIKQKIFAYQQRIKFINYTVTIIQLDVIYVIFKLSKFLINSFVKHLYAVNKGFYILFILKMFQLNLMLEF